jgi:hypothetical protein
MEEKELKRFFDTIERINQGLDPSDDDLAFVLQYSPKINEKAVDEYIAANKEGTATKEQYRTAVLEWGKKMQSDPIYKERVVKLYTEQQGQKTSDRLAEGISLVLAGTDVVNSIAQIRAGNKAAKQSQKPGKPAIPQRDVMLQQALRNAEQGTMDSGRAVAAARGEIQDQYYNDIANAKTASSGQAGAFGSYAQIAADRRNKSSLQLAPIQDTIKAREQSRYDSLLGMRQDETQQMFDNQSQFYGQDLYQYNLDQQAAAGLASTGRSNLRTGLYNLGGQVADVAGRMSAERRLRNLNNQYVAAHGDDLGGRLSKVQQNLYKYTNPQTSTQFNQNDGVLDAWNQYQKYE